MKKSFIFVLVVSVLFFSCKNKSFIEDANKCAENGVSFSESIKERIINGEYNLYETNRHGDNYLSSSMDHNSEDILFLIDNGYDFSYPDANGIYPIVTYYSKWDSLIEKGVLSAGLDRSLKSDYKDKMFANCKKALEINKDGRNVLFAIVDAVKNQDNYGYKIDSNIYY